MTWSESLVSLPRCCDVSNVSDSLAQIWHRRVAPSSGAPQLQGSVGSCSPPEEEFIQKEQEQQLERRWRVQREVEERRNEVVRLDGKKKKQEGACFSFTFAVNVAHGQNKMKELRTDWETGAKCSIFAQFVYYKPQPHVNLLPFDQHFQPTEPSMPVVLVSRQTLSPLIAISFSIRNVTQKLVFSAQGIHQPHLYSKCWAHSGRLSPLSLSELEMRGRESASQTKFKWSREWSRGFRERWSKGNEYRLWGSSPRDHAIKTTGRNYTVPHRQQTPLSSSLKLFILLFQTHFSVVSLSYTHLSPKDTSPRTHFITWELK